MTAYLDHAATTPMLPAAIAAMNEQFGVVGNASSLHAAGRRARRVVEESRERIAAAIGSRPSEIVFTSGGTEADNLALKGILWSRRDVDPGQRLVISSAIEHHAVLDALAWLEQNGEADVRLLGVDSLGRLDLAEAASALAAAEGRVALVSVMWANNEVGTVQPVSQVVDLAHEYGVPVHTDAVQAVAQLPVDFSASGVDALTLTGHKLGGPVGVGALVVRRDLGVTPLLHGGGQERDVRSGTLDVAGVAGFAAAVEETVAARSGEAKRLSALRDDLVRRVQEVAPEAIFNGDPVHRLPGNAHLKFPGCEGDSLLMLLDARGVECSTGSACSAGVAQPSHVLLAMGCSEADARSSLRFSLGHTTTQADVDALVDAIGPVVARAREAGALAGLGGS